MSSVDKAGRSTDTAERQQILGRLELRGQYGLSKPLHLATCNLEGDSDFYPFTLASQEEKVEQAKERKLNPTKG